MGELAVVLQKQQRIFGGADKHIQVRRQSGDETAQARQRDGTFAGGCGGLGQRGAQRALGDRVHDSGSCSVVGRMAGRTPVV